MLKWLYRINTSAGREGLRMGDGAREGPDRKCFGLSVRTRQIWGQGGGSRRAGRRVAGGAAWSLKSECASHTPRSLSGSVNDGRGADR